MAIITNIEDLRVLAQKRVPRIFYDYVDSGSWSESTYRANRDDFAGIQLRQRVGINVANRSLQTQMVGQDVTMPVALAPVGLTGMVHADGEILAAKAAEQFGVPFTLSTMSICAIEDIAARTTKPFWFQLYIMKDRDFTSRLIARAEAAGCSALVVTLDLPMMGQRNKDLKNGLSVPIKLSLRNLLNVAHKTRWWTGMLGTKRHSFGNIVGHVPEVSDTASLLQWTAQQLDQSVSWNDIRWIRQRWHGKLIVKGILDAEDARLATRHGVDAIVVSNHGGRQLDGAPSSIAALPGIVQAVGHEMEIHLDSGIRSGQDVLKALALGAKGVYIGRAFIYGLGAMGEAGVSRSLEIIHKELEITMSLCGITDVKQVDQSVLFKAPQTYSK
ncbi:alpha-hydroxy acid oxidase [Andreprevotia chitinilytica]|uniref:alpha-hydroxy acid oxidase n=1 Tax=Andreprevotia chitinilytica TaxID=396808 RepID=UPI000553ACE4|nr:alpha-hydroxy acid oxidase [Andreprevotia chitinilytica]